METAVDGTETFNTVPMYDNSEFEAADEDSEHETVEHEAVEHEAVEHEAVVHEAVVHEAGPAAEDAKPKKSKNDMVPIVGSAISKVKGTDFTSTALIMPANMTQEQWEALGANLVLVDNAANWWKGDWYNFGKDRFVGFAQAFTGMSDQTVANIASVCNRVPVEVRNPNLSYRHHDAVARLHKPENPAASAAKQKYLLSVAEAQGMNSDAFRTFLKNLETESNKHVPVADGRDTGEGDDGDETMGVGEIYVPPTRFGILATIKRVLDWNETQLLMIDIRDMLADQGIIVEVSFNDDDVQAALATRNVRDESIDTDFKVATYQRRDEEETDEEESDEEESDEEEAGGYFGSNEVLREPFNEDGGGDGVDSIVNGLVGSGRG